MTKQPTKCYLLNKRQRGLVIHALSQGSNSWNPLMLAALRDMRTAPIVSELRADAVVAALRSMPEPRGMSDYVRLNDQKDALALAKEIEETYLTPSENTGNGERNACI